MSGSETKEFILVRPTLRRQWTNFSKTVSKVLKLLPGLYKENEGQRLGVHVGRLKKVRPITDLGQSLGTLGPRGSLYS